MGEKNGSGVVRCDRGERSGSLGYWRVKVAIWVAKNLDGSDGIASEAGFVARAGCAASDGGGNGIGARPK